MPVGSAFAQTNNGFVGVFGDAAATIHCMQAPAGVPTTLYVVASTAGTTANGITGAEFRIEFTNPSGYFISYSAPSGAQALGDPLSSAGFNIAWPSCQVPSAGKVQLGTVMVFNAGSGGQTDIIVKRKNPPSNANYSCALLVQCDTPAYTTSCMTAPPDSVSCLTEKSRLAISSEDEFTTTLEGSPEGGQNRAYTAYRLRAPSGFSKAEADILYVAPVWAFETAVWVGINHTSENLSEWLWLQTGYAQWYGGLELDEFFEYVDKSGYPAGHHWIPTEQPLPSEGSSRRYGVVHEQNSPTITIKAGSLRGDLDWSDFNQRTLDGAQFGSESQDSPQDRTWGTRSLPVEFSNCVVKPYALDEFSPKFHEAIPPDGLVCIPYKVYLQGPGAQFGARLTSPTFVGSFWIWDERDPQ